MKPKRQSEIIQRLRCAAGHLNAVVEMAEAGKPCEQVLHQLSAVDAAIRVAGARLIICQVESSHNVIIDSPSPERRITELKRLQSLYTIFTQHSKYHSEVTP